MPGVTKTVQETAGDHTTNIVVIRSDDPSERSFENEEYKETSIYGVVYKIGVVWEYKRVGGTRFLTFHQVQVWASNDEVSENEHSQVAMFGVVGQKAYSLGIKSVGKYPQEYTFFEDGKPTSEYEEHFSLNEFDSIFACVRSPNFPQWKAASQGYNISYTWDWGMLSYYKSCVLANIIILDINFDEIFPNSR